jgi:ectoine hydroxylase-related dioxygenase (phytanoyl-CoA dioxygenase family)
VLGLDYLNSSALFDAATDTTTLDLAEHLLDDPNIELFSKGQCFYKEGSPPPPAASNREAAAVVAPGGNPKLLHQDSAYFMFAKNGACATLNYAVDTSQAKDNGPLYVIPGSHKEGHIAHVDTPSHLGLSEDEGWHFGMEGSLAIDGKAGDAIFFNIHTVHGSTGNRSPLPRASFINRYITSDDYQTYFATDTIMRKGAKAKYEEGVAIGMLPPKERNIVVRGMRSWDDDGPAWVLNEGVNH